MPEGELLPPRPGEHRDDEDGHQRGIPPPAGCRNGLIRLQRIYNFLLFHVVILTILDVL